jgi:threonine/homoserine efflux transporter RhtA
VASCASLQTASDLATTVFAAFGPVLVLLGQHLSPFELLGIALVMGASVGAVASRPAG